MMTNLFSQLFDRFNNDVRVRSPVSVPLAELGRPYRRLSSFPEHSQDLIRHLIETDDLRHALADAEPIVSWWDLNDYLPCGADPSDWDDDAK
jgi:hypothetical protein